MSVGRVLILASGCALAFSAQGWACQPCVSIGLEAASVRIIVGPRLVGESDVPLAQAQVRVFTVRKLRADEEPRQLLSCLTSMEIGKPVWKGKTDRHGRFRLAHIPEGTYWLAIRAKSAEAVYVIELPKESERQNEVELIASPGGMVNNKCDIEPIRYFF